MGAFGLQKQDRCGPPQVMDVDCKATRESEELWKVITAVPQVSFIPVLLELAHGSALGRWPVLL